MKKSKTIVPAPKSYVGGFDHLFNIHIRPNLLGSDIVTCFHKSLLENLNQINSKFILASKDHHLWNSLHHQKNLKNQEGRPILFGDNSPAASVLKCLYNGTDAYSEMSEHIAFNQSDFTQLYNNKNMDKSWTLARIFETDLEFSKENNNWMQLDVDRLLKLTVSNLHPLNYFLFPKNVNPHFWTKQEAVRTHIKNKYAEIYGSTWNDFLLATGNEWNYEAAPSILIAGKFSRSKNATASQQTNGTLQVILGEDGRPFSVRHLQKENLENIKLILTFKDGPEGVPSPVGVFHLNLTELADKGLLVKFNYRKEVRYRMRIKKDGTHFYIAPSEDGPKLRLTQATTASSF